MKLVGRIVFGVFKGHDVPAESHAVRELPQHRALELERDNWHSYNNRAAVFVGLGQYELAISDVNAGLEIAPQSGTLQTTRDVIETPLALDGIAMRFSDTAGLRGEGADVVAGTPEEFSALLRREIDKWARVAKAAGIVPE